MCVWTPVCIYTLPFCTQRCVSVVRSSGCQSVLRASLCALYCLPVALYMSFLTGSRVWTVICLHPSLGTLLIMWNRDKAMCLCAAEWQKAPVTWINASIYDGVLPVTKGTLQSNYHPTPLPSGLLHEAHSFICSVLKHGRKHWYLMAPMSFKHPLNIQGFRKWRVGWVAVVVVMVGGRVWAAHLNCWNAMNWNVHCSSL